MVRSPGTPRALLLPGLALAPALVVLAARTGQVPGGDLILPPLGRLVVPSLLTIAALAAAVTVLQAGHRLLGYPEAGRLALTALAPGLLLLTHPLSVLVLHPLGAPPALGALVTPRILGPIAAGAASFVVLRTVLDAPRAAGLRRRLAHLDARTLARPLLAMFLLLYGASALENDRASFITGDEPHYLAVTEALWRHRSPDLAPIATDGTIDLPRLLERDAFSERLKRLQPHRSRGSRAGAIYELHGIGLPLLLVGPRLLLGYLGVILFFSLVAALVVFNTFLFLHETTGRTGASLLVATLLGLTAPIGFYTRAVYPDLVATLLVVYAARVVLGRDDARWGRLAVAAVGAAFLPWLHVKFLVLTIGLVGLGFVREGPRALRAWAFALPSVCALGGLLAFFGVAYGSFTLNAQYGPGGIPSPSALARGLPGLFLDRNHGLLSYSPYWLFALAGLVTYRFERRHALRGTMILAIPYVLLVGSHWLWWGGPCPPGRFLLPVIPLFAPLLVAGVTRPAGPLGRMVLVGAMLLSLLIGGLGFQRPGELTTHRHVLYAVAPGLEAYPALPLFALPPQEAVPMESYLLLGLWLLPPLAVLVSSARRRARPASRHGHGPGAGLAAFAGLGLIVLLPGIFGVVAHAATHGSLAVHHEGLSLVQLNYHLDRLVGPQLRTRPGGPATGTSGAILRAELPINRTVAAPSSAGLARRHVLRGPYFSLYPVPYEVVFDLTVQGDAGRDIGLAYVAARDGQEVLVSARVTADGTPVRRTVTLTFRPDRVEPRGEFQAYLDAPGRLTVNRVVVTVQL
jgi:hypothetical protein